MHQTHHRRLFYAAVLAIILFVLAKSLTQNWTAILASDYPDTDDALRLVQIRDWMAGQSWFDTTQYRINPPTGGDIHWSRLIDLPMAAILWLLKPVFGTVMAERIMLTGYPLLLLAGLILLMARTLHRHFGTGVAIIGAFMLPVSMGIAIQFMPMRIDHHGVQIILAGSALALALRQTREDQLALRTALICGAILALYLSISFEALPYVLIFGGLYAWRLCRVPARSSWQALAGFAVSFTMMSGLILSGTRGFAALAISHCDAISLPWLAASASASGSILAVAALRKPPESRIAILAILGGVGAVAVGAITLTSSACLAGPFANLDPMVRDYWYINVLEGRPVWEQTAQIWVYVWGPILVGLMGTACALYCARRNNDGEAGIHWETIAILLSGASIAAVLVLRGAGVAQLFALPGTAWLILHGWRAGRKLASPAQRILATLAVAAIAPPIFVPILASAIETETATTDAAQTTANTRCMARSSLKPLAKLSADKGQIVIFAPIDLGAQVVEATPHAVIATPHHRNQAAIKSVISGFLATPDHDARIVRASGANIIIICPDANEIGNYAKDRPNSLAANLNRGTIPAWLDPVALSGATAIKAYRVKPAD